jgi:serine/threonine-protein kinase
VSRGGELEERARRSSDAPDLVGAVIGGKYRVERVLGRGGMGTIYVAVQEPLGRRVALKVLHPNLGDVDADPEFAKRFLLEAATLSQLAHPNIVVVHDYGSLDEAHGSCFMAMELLEGQTITQALQETGGRFDAARALRITRDIARALRAAHDRGIIHRDLKPSNVMLCASPDGEGELVKVLDFGLVKVMRDDSEELTAEGRFLGSPRYMSPEQIQRQAIDGRSDLYSLGVILYRMLAGDVPFAGDHAVQTLMAHLSAPPPPMPAEVLASIPPGAEALVLRLLAKRPDDRYDRAGELIRAIDALWPQLGLDLSRPSLELRLGADGAPAALIDLTPTTGTYPRLGAAAASQPGVPALLAPSRASEPASSLASSSLASSVPSTSATAVGPAGRPRRLLLGVIALGLVAGLGAALLLSGRGRRGAAATDAGSPERAQASVAPRGQAEPTAQPNDPAHSPENRVNSGGTRDQNDAPTPPPPERETFTLTIRSIPSGATVRRDDAVLGVTPLVVELERGALVAAPARFTLSVQGRAPVSFEQGPSSANVEVERELPRAGSRRGTPGEADRNGPRGADLSIKTAR